MPRFTHAELRRIVFGLMICVLLAALDQTAVVPAVPAISNDLHSYAQLAWIVSAYLIASTVSTPIYGKLSDIHGRRRLLLVCLAAFVVTSMLCGVAATLSQLIWFRALQGIGGGGLMALTQATIADVMTPHERSRYQGYLASVWAFASVGGPLVGGFFAQHLSWRWIFWINLPLGAAAMWVCQRELRRLAAPLREHAMRLDGWGMALLTAALCSLLLALGWGGSVYAWNSPEIEGLVAAGLVLLALLVRQERRAHDPVLPPRVFANASYVANAIVSTATSLVLFISLFSIPIYFQLVRHASAAGSGAFVTPFMLASATGNMAASRWGRRSGSMRGAMRAGSLLTVAGLAALSLPGPHAPTAAIVLALVAAGLGVGACLVGSTMSAQNALDSRDIGSGTAALLVLRSVGGASGSAIAGAVLAVGLAATQGSSVADAASTASLATSFDHVFLAAAALAGVSFVVSLCMPDVPLRGSHRDVPIGE